MQQHELVRTFFMTWLLSLNRSCSVKQAGLKTRLYESA